LTSGRGAASAHGTDAHTRAWAEESKEKTMTDKRHSSEDPKSDEQGWTPRIGDLSPEKDPTGGKRHPKYPHEKD